MKPLFFKRNGILFLPVHPIGWLSVLAAVVLAGWLFIVIDRNSHSASDTLIHFFVYASCVAFWWKWFAEATSEPG